MKKADFLKDVAHEVEQLKLHATPHELDNLNYYCFFPKSVNYCIYGQLTGNCGNQRAKELMDKACTKVFHKIIGTSGLHRKQYKDIRAKINGEYQGQTWKGAFRNWEYLSALEGYICLEDAKVEHIFDFLKDKVEKLKL